jgi:hypothetical protein
LWLENIGNRVIAGRTRGAQTGSKKYPHQKGYLPRETA